MPFSLCLPEWVIRIEKGGSTKTESALDFSGVVKQMITRHKRLDSDNERVITENFKYDHQNRLLSHTHHVDGNTCVEYTVEVSIIMN